MSGRKKITIEDMELLARERGGRVLSTIYQGDATKLEWECAQKHVWLASPNAIKAGKWCRLCGIEAARSKPSTAGLDEPRREARRRGGDVLSKHYLHTTSPLRWRCAEHHEWEATWANVKRGTWCPHCAGVARLTLERLREVARTRGGTCLGPDAAGNHMKIAWQCAKRHVWMATPASVVRGSWCPTCNRPAPTRLAALKRIAWSRGGRCLAMSGGDQAAATWECAKGHVWTSRPDTVKQGAWCPVCYLPEMPSLEQLQRIAAGRGGELLSDAYVSDRADLLWRCGKGHEWMVSANRIKSGRWCLTCAQARRKGVPRPRVDLEDLRALAEPHGGRCISPDYLGAKHAHQWECKEGHVWSATHGSIRKGSWCPHCDRQRRSRRELYQVERGPLAAAPEPVVGADARVARRKPIR